MHVSLPKLPIDQFRPVWAKQTTSINSLLSWSLLCLSHFSVWQTWLRIFTIICQFPTKRMHIPKFTKERHSPFTKSFQGVFWQKMTMALKKFVHSCISYFSGRQNNSKTEKILKKCLHWKKTFIKFDWLPDSSCCLFVQGSPPFRNSLLIN